MYSANLVGLSPIGQGNEREDVHLPNLFLFTGSDCLSSNRRLTTASFVFTPSLLAIDFRILPTTILGQVQLPPNKLFSRCPRRHLRQAISEPINIHSSASSVSNSPFDIHCVWTLTHSKLPPICRRLDREALVGNNKPLFPFIPPPTRT